jgi:hypothetical protein
LEQERWLSSTRWKKDIAGACRRKFGELEPVVSDLAFALYPVARRDFPVAATDNGATAKLPALQGYSSVTFPEWTLARKSV